MIDVEVGRLLRNTLQMIAQKRDTSKTEAKSITSCDDAFVTNILIAPNGLSDAPSRNGNQPVMVMIMIECYGISQFSRIIRWIGCSL